MKAVLEQARVELAGYDISRKLTILGKNEYFTRNGDMELAVCGRALWDLDVWKIHESLTTAVDRRKHKQ